MKTEKRARPTTLMIPVRNAADRKRVLDIEEALSRQVGWGVKLDIFTDAAKKEYAVVGWPMKRQDLAAVDMLLRRGKKPADPPLMTAAGVHKDKRPIEVTVTNGLSKKKV